MTFAFAGRNEAKLRKRWVDVMLRYLMEYEFGFIMCDLVNLVVICEMVF